MEHIICYDAKILSSLTLNWYIYSAQKFILKSEDICLNDKGSVLLGYVLSTLIDSYRYRNIYIGMIEIIKHAIAKLFRIYTYTLLYVLYHLELIEKRKIFYPVQK